MRKIYYPCFCLVLFSFLLLISGCQTKLNLPGQPLSNGNGDNGTPSTNDVPTKLQVTGRLIAAYAVLGYTDSNSTQANGPWSTAPDNWVYGSVCADDSHKGSDPGDQQYIVPLETYTAVPTNGFLPDVWFTRYAGVRVANDVLRQMRQAKDMSPDDTTEIGAEAHFLRAYYHFELKKIFGNPSYVDENVPVHRDTITVPNNRDIWPFIEADLQYAYNKLPETQVNLGRVNKWAAAAYLAKAYVYQHKWSEALALLHTIIAQGKNAQGLKYALLPNFEDNFNPAKNHFNDPELVFAVEYAVNDGSGAAHSNQGDLLNFPYGGGPGACCSFNQPSFSLVNAFKVDNLGLPLIGASVGADTYNNIDLKNDQGVSNSTTFIPDGNTPLDPRLDWTVGRRGIPYLDWGLMPGEAWVRNQASAGPYEPIKNTFFKSQQGVYTDNSSWSSGYTANNTMLMRFADVLLMAAEAEVEVGSLENAQQLVNRVRMRMADPATWVQGSPAHYKIGAYPAGYFVSQGQAYARRAVQFERRLELAMEGHRFFDQVRYGTAADELNPYLNHERTVSGMSILSGATFTKGKSELFPIPQIAIDLSVVNGQPMLVQNPGY